VKRSTAVRGALALFLPLLAGLAPATAPARMIDRVAAVVDEQPILLSEVEERAAMIRAMAPEDRRRFVLEDALQDLVADKLFARQVKELHLEVGDAEVQAAVDDVVRQNGFTDERQLEAAVRSQGLNMERYRANLKSRLSQMKLLNLKVRSKVKVTDEDVKRRYAELAAAEQGEQEIHARHVLVRVAAEAPEAEVAAARERARAIYERARAGEDFEALASDGKTGAEGGDLGWFRRGEMARELEQAAFALEDGQVSAPVRTRFGWHVLQVLERRAVAPRALEEIEPQLREALYREELDRQTARYLDELKKAAVIEYRMPELAPKAAR
jgi:peptidyl-prolyl cis-trans isomerase SurA